MFLLTETFTMKLLMGLYRLRFKSYNTIRSKAVKYLAKNLFSDYE